MQLVFINKNLKKGIARVVFNLIFISNTLFANEVTQSFILCMKEKSQCQKVVDLHQRNMTNYPIKLSSKDDCPELSSVENLNVISFSAPGEKLLSCKQVLALLEQERISDEKNRKYSPENFLRAVGRAHYYKTTLDQLFPQGKTYKSYRKAREHSDFGFQCNFRNSSVYHYRQDQINESNEKVCARILGTDLSSFSSALTGLDELGGMLNRYDQNNFWEMTRAVGIKRMIQKYNQLFGRDPSGINFQSCNFFKDIIDDNIFHPKKDDDLKIKKFPYENKEIIQRLKLKSQKIDNLINEIKSDKVRILDLKDQIAHIGNNLEKLVSRRQNKFKAIVFGEKEISTQDLIKERIYLIQLKNQYEQSIDENRNQINSIIDSAKIFAQDRSKGIWDATNWNEEELFNDNPWLKTIHALDMANEEKVKKIGRLISIREEKELRKGIYSLCENNQELETIKINGHYFTDNKGRELKITDIYPELDSSLKEFEMSSEIKKQFKTFEYYPMNTINLSSLDEITDEVLKAYPELKVQRDCIREEGDKLLEARNYLEITTGLGCLGAGVLTSGATALTCLAFVEVPTVVDNFTASSVEFEIKSTCMYTDKGCSSKDLKKAADQYNSQTISAISLGMGEAIAPTLKIKSLLSLNAQNRYIKKLAKEVSRKIDSIGKIPESEISRLILSDLSPGSLSKRHDLETDLPFVISKLDHKLKSYEDFNQKFTGFLEKTIQKRVGEGFDMAALHADRGNYFDDALIALGHNRKYEEILLDESIDLAQRFGYALEINNLAKIFKAHPEHKKTIQKILKSGTPEQIQFIVDLYTGHPYGYTKDFMARYMDYVLGKNSSLARVSTLNDRTIILDNNLFGHFELAEDAIERKTLEHLVGEKAIIIPPSILREETNLSSKIFGVLPTNQNEGFERTVAELEEMGIGEGSSIRYTLKDDCLKKSNCKEFKKDGLYDQRALAEILHAPKTDGHIPTFLTSDYGFLNGYLEGRLLKELEENVAFRIFIYGRPAAPKKIIGKDRLVYLTKIRECLKVKPGCDSDIFADYLDEIIEGDVPTLVKSDKIFHIRTEKKSAGRYPCGIFINIEGRILNLQTIENDQKSFEYIQENCH